MIAHTRQSAPSLEELGKRIDSLPALPSLAAELLVGLDDEGLDINGLARRISADQAIAARALRVANSPFYGLAGQITSIQEAIVVLGFRAVRALVVSAAAVNALSSLPTHCHFSPMPFWRHSIATAVVARHLALLTRRGADSAFTAALLHDIGEVVLAALLPEHYAAVLDTRLEQKGLLWNVEQAQLGYTHAEAGALLARRWHLPDSIVAAIALHHLPGEQPQELVAIVHVADCMAHGLELAHTDDPELVSPLSEAAWQLLGLSWERLPPVLERIEKEFEETVNALLA